MAELSFQEVMRQLNRLCSHYQNCGENGCPMFDECGNIGAHCSGPKHSNRIEKIVMDWAAEHPEPVYPSWFEWLEKIGVAGRAYDLEPYFIGDKEILLRTAAFTPKAFEPIPADIAEKLGLEPKEGA